MIPVYAPHLLDDRRLCPCLHQYDDHVIDARGFFDVHNPTASPHAGVCEKCHCGKFTDRVAWRVEKDAPSWSVVSPSGRQVWTAQTLTAAHQLAHSMASIDELLARVARLEAARFGADPRLTQPVRRPPKPAMRQGQSAVVVGIR